MNMAFLLIMVECVIRYRFSPSYLISGTIVTSILFHDAIV